MPLSPATLEEPWPVRTVARVVAEWVGRLGPVWMEGQVAQLSRRGGSGIAFLTLRDVAADLSLSLTCPAAVLGQTEVPVAEGQRVVVLAQPEVYLSRGQLQFAVREIRAVGLGALLARIEALKGVLRAEGLFDPARKRPLPFLPRSVGLICGRASAAERDVVEHASARWPAVRFVVRDVAVQGINAVTEVIDALRALDRDPEVDVIVLARGGGSVEDLLPWSDESLCRAVSACLTPVVSAIGHEQDSPLVDHVADRRASTPTDAGKMVVPDVTEELARIGRARRTAAHCVGQRLERELAWLAAVRTRPALAAPERLLTGWADEVEVLRGRSVRATSACVERAAGEVHALRGRVTALSPAGTLERGYAVVQRADGSVLRDAASVTVGERLRLRLHIGEVAAEVVAQPAVDRGAEEHGQRTGTEQQEPADQP